MARFSERYGYVKPSEVLIRGKITDEIQDGICNCYVELLENMPNSNYEALEIYIQRFHLKKSVLSIKKRESHFDLIETPYAHQVVIPYLLDGTKKWYLKLDLIEATIEYLAGVSKRHVTILKNSLNSSFVQNNFAYRIINNSAVEVTSEQEIQTIESALETTSYDSVKTHLNTALKYLSIKPIGEYRNSIKESISAVEAFTREITGKNTLNFQKMEEKGIIIPSTLRKGFEVLYGYTNDKRTGIRHALMDDTNQPDFEEALFMLISCSAFINYLTKKLSQL